MNPYAIILALILLAGLGSWGTYESGQASKWRGQFDSLKASYSQAAQQAKDDAQKQEAADEALNKKRASDAISQASAATSKANATKAAYDKKLADLAKSKPTDFPHICANVPMPEDLK